MRTSNEKVSSKLLRRSLGVLAIASMVAAGCGGDVTTDEGAGEGAGETAAEPGATQTDANGDGSSDLEPLRLAALPTLSGVYTQFGEMQVETLEYAVEEVNAAGGIDGRPVELTILESGGTPEDAVSLATRAVERENAPFLTGWITSADALALSSQLDRLDALIVSALSKATDLTGVNCHPRSFRAIPSNRMEIEAITDMLEQSEAESWAIMAPDYEYGHDAAESFNEVAADLGIEVTDELFSPQGTEDFGPYISQLDATDAEGLFVVVVGGDALRFANQSAQYGLLDNFVETISFASVSDAHFEALDSSAAGMLGTVSYYYDIDEPLNQEFVEELDPGSGMPTFIHGDTYLGVQMIFEGVREAGSVDIDEVAEAMHGLSFDSIVGPVSIGADGQLVRPIFKGELVNTEDGPWPMGWDIYGVADPDLVYPGPDPDCDLG